MKRPNPMTTHAELVLSAEDDGPQIYTALWVGNSEIVVNVDPFSAERILALTGARALTEFDDEGFQLVRLPDQHVKAWHTDEEAANLFALWSADQDLLQAAR